MTLEDKKFIQQCRTVIKGLNDMSIVMPSAAPSFNKATDMLEGKIKEIMDKEKDQTLNPNN